MWEEYGGKTEKEKWLEVAKKLQSIAQAGLEYSKDKYDIERFQEIREISIDILENHTDMERERIMPEIQIEVCTTQVFGKSSV